MQFTLLLQFKNSFSSRDLELPDRCVRQVDFAFSFANSPSLNTACSNPTDVVVLPGGPAGATTLRRFHSGDRREALVIGLRNGTEALVAAVTAAVLGLGLNSWKNSSDHRVLWVSWSLVWFCAA